MRHFKSLKRLKEAELSEVEAVVGKSKAALIFAAFSEKKS